MILDAGDLLYKTSALGARERKGADVAADALLGELRRTGAAALAPGERDLAAGLGAYVERVSKAKLPVLAANLVDADTGKAPFPATRLVTIGGLKVGLAGVVEAAPFERVAGVRVDPPPARAAAAAHKALAAEGAQIFVLLFHGSSRQLDTTLGTAKGWTVIVTGHDRQSLRRPERHGGALVVSGGDRGRSVGHLTLTLEGPGPWGPLRDAGEVKALEEELGRMTDRRAYYERMAKREGLKRQSKTFYEQRIAKLDEEAGEAKAKLEALKKAPVAGSRYALAMVPMDAKVADDPAAAKALAPAIKAQAALKGASGYGTPAVHGQRPHEGHGHGPLSRPTKAAAGPAATSGAPSAPPPTSARPSGSVGSLRPPSAPGP